MRKEKDQWDEAVRSKMFDFEVEPLEGGWEKIAERLPAGERVEWHHAFRRWAAVAAAVIACFLGGLAWLDFQPTPQPLAEEMHEDRSIPSFSRQWIAESQPQPTVPSISPKQSRLVARSTALANVPSATQVTSGNHSEQARSVLPEIAESDTSSDEQREATFVSSKSGEGKPLTKATESASSQSRPRKSPSPKPKKWGFGVGAGSLSVGSDQVLPQYVTNTYALRSENLMSMNAAGTNMVEAPKTDIQHKAPLGFGLSVSRYLSDRFSLQTGLNYSYLRSEWSTNGTYHLETDQRLHFIGLPLSIAYRIAEWNRFTVYASAGGMMEINVAGKQQMRLYSDQIAILKQTEHVRMKEPLWSVNGKVGISYPLIRFVNAFAEAGACYYFDNHSSIETIHSEKPFSLSMNLGFRLGF